MTECERLISEGVFDKSFFEEENRDGFWVDSTRKKVWAIEIDLLTQLDRVCKKYGLQYFLMFGSLLGAIRHNGFIPWDDDIDVCMPRKDYEQLLCVASDEFKHPYFFQTPESDPGYYYTFAKIRNCNTTAFLDLYKYQRFNMGILIDVFPIDVCNSIDVSDNYKTIQKLTRDNTTYMRMSHHYLSAKDKERVRSYSGGVPYDTYCEIQRIASMHEDEREYSQKRIVSVCTVYPFERMTFDKNDLAETVLHVFEGFMFPIPIGFDNILHITYGDYMKYPPFSERGKWHDYLIDPDRSYINYMK